MRKYQKNLTYLLLLWLTIIEIFLNLSMMALLYFSLPLSGTYKEVK